MNQSYAFVTRKYVDIKNTPSKLLSIRHSHCFAYVEPKCYSTLLPVDHTFNLILTTNDLLIQLTMELNTNSLY